MTKLASLTFIFILILFGCNSTNTQVKVAPSDFDNLSQNLDEYFNALTELDKFNGAVLVQKNGKRILYDVYNMDKNKEGSLNVNKSSQFDIHSISKLMAQAAVVNLERNNLIDRNDKLNKYIPDFPKGDLISIQQLIKNQSGLPRGFSTEYPDLIDKNPDEVVNLIKQEPLLYEPGTETLYSNLGYQLLYYIISKITNKPFVHFLDQDFFEPLQMNNSGAHFYLTKNNLNHLVKNHELDDDELVVVPNVRRDGKNQAKIYSTIDDLLKFIDHVKSEPYKSSLKNKNDEIGWSGGGDGILCHAKASLKSDYEIVFFSNYDEIPFGEILEVVEKIMLNEPYDLPKEINRMAVQVDRNILKEYIGKYRVKEFNNDVFEFRLEGDRLVFYQNGERNTVLSAESDTTFFDQPDSEDYFEFRQLETKGYEMIFYYKKIEVKGIKIIKD